MSAEVDTVAPVITAPTKLREVVKVHTMTTLSALGGNMSATARALGIDRRTLYRWLERDFDQWSPARVDNA